MTWIDWFVCLGFPFHTKEKLPFHESSNKALVGHEALSIYWLSNLLCFIEILFVVLYIIWWFILMQQKYEISPSILDLLHVTHFINEASSQISLHCFNKWPTETETLFWRELRQKYYTVKVIVVISNFFGQSKITKIECKH